MSNFKMFCYQCSQSSLGKGCINHEYLKLRKYENLFENIGKACYNQKKLFSEIPAVIVVAVLPEVKHVSGYGFSEIIEKEKKLPQLPDKEGDIILNTGFSLSSILIFDKILSKDKIIIIPACGKFRFNDLQLGDIDGIPRLIDIGQCNDIIVSDDINGVYYI